MKLKIGLFLILLFFGSYFYFRLIKPPSPSPIYSYHPLSIESLRSRQFPIQSLNIVSSVTANSQIVSYDSDGFQLFALMITPPTPPPSGGYPVVIVNHGHIPPYQYSITKSYINTANFFAQNGFLVLKPDYRGHDRSQGDSSGRLLARCEYAVDVLHLLSAIDSLPNVNPDRIYMYGHSMGGDITLQILEISSKIKAASLWAPAVTDYPEVITYFIKNRSTTVNDFNQFNIQYPEFITKYPITQISSIDNLDKISVPLNLHHGTADQSVPYSWGVTLAQKLTSLNKTVNFYEYAGDNHDIAAHWTQALSRDVELFNQSY